MQLEGKTSCLYKITNTPGQNTQFHFSLDVRASIPITFFFNLVLQTHFCILWNATLKCFYQPKANVIILILILQLFFFFFNLKKFNF